MGRQIDKIQDYTFRKNSSAFFRLLTVGMLVLCLYCAPVSALETFLYVGYPDSGRVYRVTTSDENQFPVGYLFAAGPAEAFFVDQLKNFRLMKSSPAETFKPVSENIYRQVFAGTALAADWGNGHAQHQDQRSLISPDEAGKAVFRPTGAPFSAGLGQPAVEEIAKASLQTGECESVAGKNWYRIPNASWYQTWFSREDQHRPSYKIYFDVWEKGESVCVESFWRGYHPGKALERTAAICVDKRFRRAQINGAMELINRDNEIGELPYFGGKSFLHIPAGKAGEGDLLVYNWAGKDPGNFFLNGQHCDEQPVVESKTANRRFAGCGFTPGGTRRIYVMGTDILQMWLQSTGMEADQAECTQAVFAFFPDNLRTMAVVYSARQNCVYRFFIDEANGGKIMKPEVISVKIKPCSIYLDAYGNLYLATIEKRPEAFSNPEDYVAGFETLEYSGNKALQTNLHDELAISKNMHLKRDIAGRLVFSQTSNAALYVVNAGQSELNWLGNVFLDKTYFSRNFSFKNISENELSGSITDVLKIAKKPENTITEINGDVPGFPDQFREPMSLFISVYQD